MTLRKFVDFLSENKRAKRTNRHSHSTSCEEKLCRKFSPTETRTFNFYESGEARYGLFTDTGVYKLGSRKPNTMLSRYCVYICFNRRCWIGNSKEDTLQQVVESFVKRKSSEAITSSLKECTWIDLFDLILVLKKLNSC